MPIPADLIEVLTKRSGGRDVMGLTLEAALSEYAKAKAEPVQSTPGEVTMTAPVDTMCSSCRAVIPMGDTGVFVPMMGFRHPTGMCR